MPKFSYTAIDTTGKQKSGILSAASSDEATAQIKSMGLFVTNLVAQDKVARAKGGRFHPPDVDPSPSRSSTPAKPRGPDASGEKPLL
jgi:type II secretory pathway component PulF